MDRASINTPVTRAEVTKVIAALLGPTGTSDELDRHDVAVIAETLKILPGRDASLDTLVNDVCRVFDAKHSRLALPGTSAPARPSSRGKAYESSPTTATVVAKQLVDWIVALPSSPASPAKKLNADNEAEGASSSPAAADDAASIGTVTPSAVVLESPRAPMGAPAAAARVREVLGSYAGDVSASLETRAPEAVAAARTWKSIQERGVDQVVAALLEEAARDSDASLAALFHRASKRQAAANAIISSPDDRSTTTPRGPGTAAGGSGMLMLEETSPVSVGTAALDASDGDLDVTNSSTATPFVSILAAQHLHRSLLSVWDVQAALLFIDISGYSAIATALAKINPFELSRVVNSYFDRLLSSVRQAGGDVIKFAGDAVLCAWHSASLSTSRSLRAAIACALRILERHGTYHVAPAGTLGVHIGVAVGEIRSRLFMPPMGANVTAMQPAYHFVSGEPLAAVSRACDLAKRSQVVIHSDAASLMAAEQSSCPLDLESLEAGPKGPTEAEVESRRFQLVIDMGGAPTERRAEHFVPLPRRPASTTTAHVWFRQQGNPLSSCVGPATAVTAVASRDMRGTVPNELLFVPPRVSELLAVGVDPLLMAHMRELVVLFIKMGDSQADSDDVESDPTVWFFDVHAILRRYGCAVVQVLDDDKGTHIVAAFGLYHTTVASADRCVEVAAELRQSVASTYVGAAAGTVFCGVFGHQRACSWDISGAACVRACRLMQHGAANQQPVVLDESVYALATDRSLFVPLASGPLQLKGADRAVTAYSIAAAAVATPPGLSPEPQTEYQMVVDAARRASVGFCTDASPDFLHAAARRASLGGTSPDPHHAAARRTSVGFADHNPDGSHARRALPRHSRAGPAVSPPSALKSRDTNSSPSVGEGSGEMSLILPAVEEEEVVASPEVLMPAAAAAAASGLGGSGGVHPRPSGQRASLVMPLPFPATTTFGGRRFSAGGALRPDAVLSRAMLKPPRLHFGHTLSRFVFVDVVKRVREVVLDGAKPSGKRTVIIRGPPCVGKFGVALSALEGTGFVPLVHSAGSARDDSSLELAHSLGTWFALSINRHVAAAAAEVLHQLSARRWTAAFNAALDLVRTIAARRMRVAIVVRGLQLLDSGSLSLLRVIHEEFAATASIALLVTCDSIPSAANAHTFLGIARDAKDERASDTATASASADGALHLLMQQLPASEATAVVCHCFKSRVDEVAADWIYYHARGYLGWIVELCAYLQAKALSSPGTDGALTLRPAARAAVEATSWTEIAPSLTARVMQIVDELGASMLIVCNIVAAITEQPGVTAHQGHVALVAQKMIGQQLDEGVFEHLEAFHLLRQVPHACGGSGSHTLHPERQKNAAEFFVPPARDVIAGALTPPQREQINATCAALFDQSHPTIEPHTFLVRARHHRFSGNRDAFEADTLAGWRLLSETADARDEEEVEALKSDFYELLAELPPEATDRVLSKHDCRRMRNLSHLRRRQSSASSTMMGSSIHRRRSVAGSEFDAESVSSDDDHGDFVAAGDVPRNFDVAKARLHVITLIKRDKPLSLGPARHYLNVVLAEAQSLLEAVNDAEERAEDIERLGLCVEDGPFAEPALVSVTDPDSLTLDDPASVAALSCATLPDSIIRRFRTALTDYRLVFEGQGQPLEPGCDDDAEQRAEQDTVNDVVEEYCRSVSHQLADVFKAECHRPDAILQLQGPPTSDTLSLAHDVARSIVVLVSRHVANDLPSLERLFGTHRTSALLQTTRSVGSDIGVHAEEGDAGGQSYHVKRVARAVNEDEVEDGVQHAVSAFEDAGADLARDASALVVLYSHLPQVLDAYCGRRSRLREAFVEGLRAFYESMFEMEGVRRRMRQGFFVFLALWANCCRGKAM